MMKKSKGFTLIELLAVIVIVGILITLVSIGVAKYVKTSKEKVKVQAAEEIIEIAKAYMVTNNVYLVSTATLIDEGYLESNFTDPKTGKEHQNSDADIFVITCTDDSCSKDNKVTDNGFSTDKFYLSLNSTLNSNLPSYVSTSEDFSFDKGTLEVKISNNTYTKNTIGERIRKLYEVNKNKGVLVMSLAENEKEKLKNESGFENVDNNYYLYYDGETLKSKSINDTDVDRENMKFLGAKYIVDIIRKNNKNYEIIKPSNGGSHTLDNLKIKSLFNYGYNEIINPYEGSIGISDPENIYIFYYTDSKGNYYQVNNYKFY